MEILSYTLSTVDLVVLVLVFVLGVYYLFLRRKESTDDTQYKKLAFAPPMTRAESYDPSFVNKMEKTGKNVVVFYGSQTGTAEEFAGRLAKDANRYGMKALVADPEECEMNELGKVADIENSLAIFCVATYGEGDPTDNAQEFVEILKSGDVELNGLNYAVFGLGNKTYEHYNEIGKLLDKRLEELGGNRVYSLGMGDDDANIEEDFITWCEGFWPAVCEHYHIDSTALDINLRQFALTVHEPGEVPEEKIFIGEPARIGSFVKQKPPFDMKNPFLSKIVERRELHTGGGRSCMHIEFDIEGSRVRYESGDHLSIHAPNEEALVLAIGRRLNVDLDQIITLTNLDEEASKKHPFPCPTTYRTALTHYLDINSPPRTHVLKEVIEYAADEKDKQFLASLTAATHEAKSLYNEWVLKDRRNLLAVLEDLPSLMPPLDHLCELLPRLQTRYYSISSSPKYCATRVSITAVLIRYETRTKRIMNGVATNYLATLNLDDEPPRIPIYVRKSAFKLPFRSNTPVCMIGPGTGLAPFRGFIQERDYFKKEGKPLGKTVLFFGCRNKSHDYIYEEELNEYVKKETLSKLHVAFSRDQKEKVYVQNLLDLEKDSVWELMEKGGHIYVCGDAKNMAPEVLRTLQNIVATKKSCSFEDAVNYMKKMSTRGRYSADVWT